MASKTFVDFDSVNGLVDAEWANEVDAIVHDIFGGASTKVAARLALFPGIVDNSAATVITIDASNDTTFGGSVSIADNKTLYVGSGNDFRAIHNGTNTYLANYTGTLYIESQVNSGYMLLGSLDSVGAYKSGIQIGGAIPNVVIHYNGSAVLTSSSTGADLSAGQELTMDRTTDDDGFINFKATIDADATSAISSFTTSGATTHHIQILLNGIPAWIAVSTTDPTA